MTAIPRENHGTSKGDDVKKTLYCSAILMASATAIAGDFEIKNYEVGMPHDRHPMARPCRVDTNGNGTCFDTFSDFTIGGQKISSVMIEHRDWKAVSIFFSFPIDSFDGISKTVANRYKSLKCKNGFVYNAIGARFKQTICTTSTKSETIIIHRISGSIEEGSMLISSNEKLDRDRNERDMKNDDI